MVINEDVIAMMMMMIMVCVTNDILHYDPVRMYFQTCVRLPGSHCVAISPRLG